MLPTVSVFMALSLDGFIADLDGGVDWLNDLSDPQNPDPEDYGYGNFIKSVDALVMGRSTLEQVLGFDGWPYGDLGVVVLTHRPPPPDLPQAARISFSQGEPRTLMQTWRDQGYRHIYLDGGKVVQDFLAADLIDDMTLTQVPILLGDGIPLFRQAFDHTDWIMESTTSYPNGFVRRVLKRKRARIRPDSLQ